MKTKQDEKKLEKEDVEKLVEKSKPIKKEEKIQEGKLVQKEKIKSGNVSFKLLIEYLKSCNVLLTVIFMVFYILNAASQIGASFWLSDWSNNFNTSTSSKLMRFGVYIVIGFSQCKFHKQNL